MTSAMVIGHRGDLVPGFLFWGALLIYLKVWAKNVAARKSLQLGENTIQVMDPLSFLCFILTLYSLLSQRRIWELHT